MKLSRSLLIIAALGVGAIVALGCKLSTDHGDDPSSGPNPGAQAAVDPSGPATDGDEPGPRHAHRHHGPRHGRGGGRKAWAQGQGDDGPEGPRGPWGRGGGDGPGDELGPRGRWGHGRGGGQGDPQGPRRSWGEDDAPDAPGPTQL